MSTGEPADRTARAPRKYRAGNPEIDDAIDRVVALLLDSQPARAAAVREIMTTAAKLSLDGAALGDVKLTNSAMKELRYAYKLFSPWRHHRKVTVFGSARTKPAEAAYVQAVELGRAFAAIHWMVITGAGGGIMEAAHGGAGREASFGVNIHLPFEQQANEVVRGGDKLVNFKYFFTRKLTFIKETDAVVLFPGGFGTHDEGFETLTLLQTGKSDPLPVVFIEPPGSGYWAEWLSYVERHLMGAGLISPGDLSLFRVVDDVAAAVEEVTGFYRVYHSQRYVRSLLVIRMQHELSPQRLEELNAEFAPIVKSGRIEQRAALPEESETPELAHLPRLVFEHRRDDFATLRRLIDRINETPESERRLVAPAAPAAGPERSERGATPETAGLET